MVEPTTAMSKTLDSILAAPPLQRITPAAKEAIASVEALAAQQANAPQEAVTLTGPPPENKGLSCSFAWSPEALKLDLVSAQKVLVDAAKIDGQFTITIRF